MDNVMDGKRYELDEDFELAFTEERGRQRALIFLKGAPVSCAATGWADSNKAVRRHARKLVKAIQEGKAPLVRQDRSERKAAPAIVAGPVPADLVPVFDRVFGRGKWIVAAALALMSACSTYHVRPAPDAGAPSCLVWRQRDNPEDVYCAQWASDDASRP